MLPGKEILISGATSSDFAQAERNSINNRAVSFMYKIRLSANTVAISFTKLP